MDNKLLPLKCPNMENNLPNNNLTLNPYNNTLDLDNKTLEYVHLTLNAELENAALNGDFVELDLPSVVNPLNL